MSAEVLRRAASLMRERAEASFAEGSADEEPWYNIKLDGRLLTKWDSFAAASPTDAEHIASWHPAVALAVANWLAYVAESHDETACPAMAAAEQVAHAYLGEES